MFEFDETKSELNRKKHGIDFMEARLLRDDSDRVVIPARWVNEQRFILIARINEAYWSAIYTQRNGKIRIISVRKSRNNEKEIYNSG